MAMKKVSVAEARNTLTKLIRAAEKGERVTVCRHGRPVADIVPAGAPARKVATTEASSWIGPRELEKWLEKWLRGEG